MNNPLEPVIVIIAVVMTGNFCLSFVISSLIKEQMKTKYPGIYARVTATENAILRSLASSKLVRHPPSEITDKALLRLFRTAKMMTYLQAIMLVLFFFCGAFGSRLK